jgi:hypothetical protein
MLEGPLLPIIRVRHPGTERVTNGTLTEAIMV